MPGKIYLLQDDGSLQVMSEHAYATEKRLQQLIKDYPDLLAGDQMDEENPRRWLLVSREVGVPVEEDGGDWMSLDHLFLDQDAIPTLVEVKRSSDARIRREVVGQMLDYASNAVAYWSVDRLRMRFEAACEEQGSDPAHLVAELIGRDPEDKAIVATFWERVKTNLQAGNIRLVFAADEIPSGLRRVVEFLNMYMSPVEVLAVEIHQYVGEGFKTLVPRVLGQTAQAQGRKRGRTSEKRQWDRESFLQALQERRGTQAVAVASQVLAWAERNGLRIWWGQGRQDGSFFPMLDHQGESHWLISVWTYGRVEVQFEMLKKRSPFDSEVQRLELLRRLNEIAGINLPKDGITRRPSIRLLKLEDDAVLQQFLAAFDWVIEEIKSCSQADVGTPDG